MVEATPLPPAWQALADRGVPDGDVRVRVHLEREPPVTRFRYELILDPALEPAGTRI